MLWGDEFASPITKEDFYKILNGKKYKKYFDKIRSYLQKGARAANKNFDQAICDHAVQQILRHCWHYFLACRPAAKKGRRLSGLKNAVKESATYAEKLRIKAKILFGSDEPIAREALKIFPYNALEFLDALEKFHFISSRLEQILSDDNDCGGKNPSSFEKLVVVMAGVYKMATDDVVTTSKRDNFFAFVSTIINLLDSAKDNFPSTSFDLPLTAEALRKALDRAWK